MCYILPNVSKKWRSRQNMIYYILPNVVFLLYLRQNIRIMSTIIGRRSEVEELEKLYRSERPEFVAVYGRRRVGKTFLIKQALKGRITFQHTGVSPVDRKGKEIE